MSLVIPLFRKTVLDACYKMIHNTPSSVRSTDERVGRKRKDVEELIHEMEEREAEKEMEAVEREER